MSLLQEYARDFTPDIRKRGEAYQRDRAVQITDSGPSFVEADVTGTDVYRVMVEHDQDEGPKYDCDCPYFADHGPCKHCWATVVEAFEQGALPGGKPADGEAAARPEPRVVPVEAEGMDEDAPADEGDDDGAETADAPGNGGGFVSGQRQPTVEELRRMSPQELVQAMRYKAPPKMFEEEDRRRNLPKNEDAWKNQLKRLSDAMAARPAVAPKPLAWPKGRRVVYVVDQRQTLENGLTLVPMQETPKRDGGYERARLLRISAYQVGQLPDPIDRQIIQLLTGTGRSGFGYYYDMPLAEAFDVDESATEDVLKQVCATGRCRLAPEGNDGPLIPVRWDDGPAWEFCLHLRPSPGGRYLILDGLLRRPKAAAEVRQDAAPELDDLEEALAEAREQEDATAEEGATPDVASAPAPAPAEASPATEAVPDVDATATAVDPNADFDTVPLSEPHLLLHGMVDGFVFLDGTVARLRHFDAFPLITALRGGEEIRVPLDKQTDLLKMLLKFPRLPRLQLPADLDIAEVAPVPRPKLKLSSPGRGGNLSGGRDALVAKLTFDYDGIQIDRNDPQAAVVTDDGRKLLRRDAQREAAYVADLPGLGFRDEGNYFNKNRELRLPANKLPKAVAELTRKGWTVEADGKLYRSAGQVTVSVSSGIDWFELHGTVSFDGMNASLPQLLHALRKGDGVVKLDDGTFGLLPEDWLKKYAGLAGLGETEGDTIKFSTRQVGFLDALLTSMPEARFDEAFSRARDELMRFSGIEAIAPPVTFQGVLRQYQSEGLGWMAFLRKFGFGGVLADDMGLGKTVQVLALLEARCHERAADRQNAHGAAVGNGNGSSNGHAHANGDAPVPVVVNPATRTSGPTLVVAPRSLVFNWKSEAHKFAPSLRVLDHTAVDRVRSADHFQDYDLVITTYGTLRRDMSYFKDVRFDYAILDEAQAIKNAASESAKAARLIQADYRLCLSGTPVQNHLGELWSLFDFLNPGMMGSLGVFKELSADAANKDATARELLARALRPFILRRTKEQVAKDLPEKLEQTIVCELEKDQRKLYDELRDHYRTSLLERVAKEGMNKAKIMVLEALLRLRQAACHPGLIDKTRTGESSAKLETLMDHIAEIVDEGHKVLVFSQFTSFLSIVRERLDKQQAVYEYLDGRTKDRQARVDRFQSDKECKLFLISLKAGGVGLNLTAADYVFLLDPWWNPAVEAQAIDRAHRIGQTQRVFAYRLIAKDTVEEKVIQLQQTKKDLADAIINADNSLIRGLSREDLEMLLS